MLSQNSVPWLLSHGCNKTVGGIQSTSKLHTVLNLHLFMKNITLGGLGMDRLDKNSDVKEILDHGYGLVGSRRLNGGSVQMRSKYRYKGSMLRH